MRTLHVKALRDLWHLRSQALAIALVIAAGLANLVMSRATLESLSETRERFYRDYAFADVFAQARRVPESVAERIREIDGVQALETRLVAGANLSVPGFDDPVRALMVSLADSGEPVLNRPYLRAGRMLAPGSEDEAVISEAFAEAHGFVPGDTLSATIYGRHRKLHIVGIALSPEFVYQIQPGTVFPDFRRFAIVWMNRRALEAALDMDGAFNNVTLKLVARTRPEAVIEPLDAVLADYGGLGAYGREDQISNRFLSEELRQLDTMARIFPTIFLGVAAFLLNVVISRLVGMQRDQIAILKAFGYSNRAIGLHYALLVSLIVAIGVVIGLLGGLRLGQWMAGVYQEFYRFPFLDFRMSASVFALGVGVSLLAAFIGTAQAVVTAARLPPAEAMRPPAPERYRPALFERFGLARFLSQPTRMVLRHIERRPWKSLLTVVGLAFACAIMMIGRFQTDAIDYMIDVQFRIGQRNDLSVDFTEGSGERAAHELRALPGVLHVESYRNVPVRLHAGHRSELNAIQGLRADSVLKRPVDRRLRRVPIPAQGLLLTDYLAGMLGVEVGDVVEIEVLEGRRRRVEAVVAAVVNEYLGVNAYMDLDALNRLLGDGDRISGVLINADPEAQTELYRMLERRPRISGIGVRKLAIQNFYDTLGESLGVFTYVALILGGVINFGVVYNAARVSLSERGRDLASLRVLGFTRGEVAYVLIGELAVLVLLSIPLGFLTGYMLSVYMATSMQSELFRIPVLISAETYGFAALAMLGSTVLSAWIVQRRVAHLDLIGVLKTRE
ncbi:MAG: ABC transporter permease [Xanthomonadales bacterium]|nr:ABC transporter permease [Xanthomonadales bacterium]